MAGKRETVNHIAFVFSGGMARGAVQLAFFNEILQKIGYERVRVISSSSIGALNGYAVGVNNIPALLDFYGNLDCDNIKQFMKKIRNDLFNDVFNLIEGADIAPLNFPVYVTGTRLIGLTCDYYCLNKMKRIDIKGAINASMSFPIVNGPVNFNGKLYVDGGTTDNIPVLPVTYYDPDMVIILHNYSKYYPPADLYEKLPNSIIIDIDETLALPTHIGTFSLGKADFKDMLTIGKAEGKKFADWIFEDFSFDGVKKRTHEYIKAHLDERAARNPELSMSSLDIINSLYLLKEEIV